MILVAGFAGFLLLDGPWNVIALVAAGVIEVGETWAWITFLRRYRVRTGAEGLIGERGEVIEACRPSGRVRVRGEIWHADCAEGADAGDPVEVGSVEGLRLTVVPASGGRFDQLR